MFKQLHRLFILFQITTLKEFLQIIIHQFITKKLAQVNPSLHRLIIFAVACNDKSIHISKQSNELLFLNWKEEQVEMKFYIRKYTRDLLVFNQFFIDNDYIQFIKLLKTSSHKEYEFIIDAGANIGCSAFFFLLHFSNAKIVCIEPEESNYKMLIKNIEINNKSLQILALQNALWNEITELELMQRDWSHDGFHVMQKSVPDEIIAKTITTTIPKLMLDFNYEQIDLIKVDIEGAEKTIFEDKSHLQLFLPKIGQLIIEVHNEFISEEIISKTLNNYSFEYKKIIVEGQPSVIIAYK
jgi:FkbM family methyltransferase